MAADRVVAGVVLVVLGLVFLLPLCTGFLALTQTVGLMHLTGMHCALGPQHIVHSIGYGIHALARLIIPAVLIGLGVFLVRRAG